jgi:hypothetical protein
MYVYRSTGAQALARMYTLHLRGIKGLLLTGTILKLLYCKQKGASIGKCMHRETRQRSCLGVYACIRICIFVCMYVCMYTYAYVNWDDIEAFVLQTEGCKH